MKMYLSVWRYFLTSLVHCFVVSEWSCSSTYCQPTHRSKKKDTAGLHTHTHTHRILVDVSGQSNSHALLPWQQKANHSESNKKQEVASFPCRVPSPENDKSRLHFPFYSHILSMSLSLFNPWIVLTLSVSPFHSVIFHFASRKSFLKRAGFLCTVLFSLFFFFFLDAIVFKHHSESKCVKLLSHDQTTEQTQQTT